MRLVPPALNPSRYKSSLASTSSPIFFYVRRYALGRSQRSRTTVRPTMIAQSVNREKKERRALKFKFFILVLQVLAAHSSFINFYCTKKKCNVDLTDSHFSFSEQIEKFDEPSLILCAISTYRTVIYWNSTQNKRKFIEFRPNRKAKMRIDDFDVALFLCRHAKIDKCAIRTYIYNENKESNF